MIDLGKTYVTRCGEDVKMLAKSIDGRIVGMVGDTVCIWDEFGVSEVTRWGDLILKEEQSSAIGSSAVIPRSALGEEMVEFIDKMQQTEGGPVAILTKDFPRYVTAFIVSQNNEADRQRQPTVEKRPRLEEKMEESRDAQKKAEAEDLISIRKSAPAPDFELLKRFATTAMAFVVSEAQIASAKTSTAVEDFAESGLSSASKIASNIDVNKIVAALPVIVSAVGGIAALFANKPSNGK